MTIMARRACEYQEQPNASGSKPLGIRGTSPSSTLLQGHARSAAIASMPALPRPLAMVLADPAGVLVAETLHANSSAPAGKKVR
jgi:hypothetical protein